MKRINKKIKTETISAEAYKKCLADVEEEANNQKEIMNNARNNGEKLISGLVKPFLDQLDKDYKLNFEWRVEK